ncbi:DoxX family membrane protein [Gandjariella thermophila]|uniref:Membrane protein n=1 Tax=Gandjariella thermophila TaxID=1931992 RepID=A0A4D4JFH3_9PSEU|nr:DoxX family membrane protein [Gandjariella thermophila]GDY33408.1 membrane protein [Gandjariella thermophila]
MLTRQKSNNTTPEAVPAPPAAAPHPGAGYGTAARMLALLRIATGFVFLWAFLDKLLGLGYSTPSAAAWINGGSPAKGFLGHVNVGPFAATFHGWAGAAWADWLFMLGLAGIGIAVLTGVALRIAALSGTVMLLLMWAAEWPLAQHTTTGQPSGSTNPLLDYHIIYALVLIVLAATGAGDTWGLGRWWSARITRRYHHPWLR